MKKIIALVAVCGFAIAFASCGKKAEPAAEAVDTVAVEAPVAADTTAVDTTAADTTAAH